MPANLTVANLTLSPAKTSSFTTKEDIQALLEWAGIKLLSMPISGVGPKRFKSNWPDYFQDNKNIFNISSRPFRPVPPNGYEIDTLDKIFDLITLVDSPLHRRILQSRSLIVPLSGRNLYSWMDLATLLDLDRRTVKRYYFTALNQIVIRSKISQIRYLTSQIK